MSDTFRRRLDETERRRARRAIVRSSVRASLLAVLVLAAYYVAPVRGGSQPGIVLRIVAVGTAFAPGRGVGDPRRRQGRVPAAFGRSTRWWARCR